MELEAALLCRAAQPAVEPPVCSMLAYKAGCDAELAALEACIYPAGPCESGACEAGSNSGPAVTCSYTCGGVVYDSACGDLHTQNASPMDCVCQIDGDTVGTCQTVTGSGVGFFGCCAAHYAESE